MKEERKRILEMLSEGKISTDDAEKLLSALSRDNETVSEGIKKEPRYLRVMVEPGAESKSPDKVNVRIPLKLIRAGLKLASLIPKNAQHKVNEAFHEKGIDMDFSKINSEDLEDLIRQLDDFSVDVDVEGKESVRIFCE